MKYEQDSRKFFQSDFSSTAIRIANSKYEIVDEIVDAQSKNNQNTVVLMISLPVKLLNEKTLETGETQR